MTDGDDIEERLEAVERALTESDGDLTALADAADLAERIERLEGRLDDVEEEVTDLDAATQALRGYVGNVRSVNRDVERRADAALAKAEALESRVGDPEDPGPDGEAPGRSDDGDHEREHGDRTDGRQHGRRDERGDRSRRRGTREREDERQPAHGHAEPRRCDHCGAPRGERARTNGSGDRGAAGRGSAPSTSAHGRRDAGEGQPSAADDGRATTGRERGGGDGSRHRPVDDAADDRTDLRDLAERSGAAATDGDADGGFLAGLRDTL